MSNSGLITIPLQERERERWGLRPWLRSEVDTNKWNKGRKQRIRGNSGWDYTQHKIDITLHCTTTTLHWSAHCSDSQVNRQVDSKLSPEGFEMFSNIFDLQGVGGGGVWVWSCQSRYLLLMVELGGTKINPGHREKPFLKSIILMESKFCWRDGVWCDNIYNTRTWNTRLGEQG